MKEIESHPLALREAADAIRFFRKNGMKPVSVFIRELDDVYEAARLTPKFGSPFRAKYRFLRLKTYSYTVYYQELRSGYVYVYAVAHDSRRSAYWIRRKHK